MRSSCGPHQIKKLMRFFHNLMQFLGPHQISPLKCPKKNDPQVTTQKLQPSLSSLTSLTIPLSSHSLSSSNNETQPLLFSSPQRHQHRHLSLHLILSSPTTPPTPSFLSSFPHLFTNNAISEDQQLSDAISFNAFRFVFLPLVSCFHSFFIFFSWFD